jgi:regulator-associated protein of mTOR
MVSATQSDFNNNSNNEDARSTSSTLVSGEHAESSRNDVDVPERSNPTAQEDQDENTNHIRHGFDQELYEEDIIRFLYFSEKRHDSNAKPNAVVRNALKDWVTVYLLLLWN